MAAAMRWLRRWSRCRLRCWCSAGGAAGAPAGGGGAGGGLGGRGRRAPVRGRGVGWWPREVALASASLLVLTGVGSTDSADATADTATVHQFVLTDNPGNWFDAGVDIAGTGSLVVAAPGDKVRFIVRRPESETVHTATSLLFPTGAAGMPLDAPTAFRGTEQVRSEE